MTSASRGTPRTDRMQAAVLEAPRRLRVVERAVPVAEQGQVVVRIANTAVCHTDLAIYTGEHPGVRYPVVMGHEATGTVASVGPGVSGIAPGLRVLINPIIACGRCDLCASGAENLCRNAGLFGRELEGSLRGYACLPARFVHPLPDHVPLDAATIIETLAVARHAQERVAIRPGEAVTVLGQGAAGLLHTRLARLAGADPVIAVSRTPWKLEMARRMGAHQTIQASAKESVSQVLAATRGAGASVVVDAAGGPEAFAAAIDMLRPGGRISAFAVEGAPVPDFNTFPIYFKEISIIGSRALLPADITVAIDLFASNKVDVSGFITAKYPLAEAAASFQEYERNPGGILRILITSDAS